MLDTRDSRASAIGCGLLWRVILPDADGTVIGAGDRQHLSALYRSVLASSSEPPSSPALPQTPIAALVEVAAPIAELL